jgi:hypothetical protein
MPRAIRRCRASSRRLSANQSPGTGSLREKKPKQRQRLQKFDPSNLEHVEMVAISGPVLLRESMKLLADQATADRD